MPAIVGRNARLRAYLADTMHGPRAIVAWPAEGDGRVGKKRLEMLSQIVDAAGRSLSGDESTEDVSGSAMLQGETGKALASQCHASHHRAYTNGSFQLAAKVCSSGNSGENPLDKGLRAPVTFAAVRSGAEKRHRYFQGKVPVPPLCWPRQPILRFPGIPR